MAFDYRLVFLASLLATFNCIGRCLVPNCQSPQYLTYGKVGTINCLFHDDFFSVLWFDKKDYRQKDPILHYQDFAKSGAGYESGEFDIHPNGSLIINNVSLERETTFTTLYVHSKTESVVLLRIFVVAIVKPKESFPQINYCANRSKCFAVIGSNSVNCSVESARPSVPLTWASRTVHGDRNITNDTAITPVELGYTSHIATGDVSHDLPLLVLLVCKTSGLQAKELLLENESMLLAQTRDISVLSTARRLLYIEQYTKLILDCKDDNVGFAVWKKILQNDGSHRTEHKTLAYSIFLGEEWKKVFLKDLSLENKTALVASVADIKHEGLYYCLYGNGLNDGSIVYDVTVKVKPIPPYPIVDGCDEQQNCVLESNFEGRLNCELKGIRPQVQLQFGTFYKSDAAVISFTNQHLAVKEKGKTFDVTLTSTYNVRDVTRDRLTIECKVQESSEKLFHMATKIELLFEKGPVDPTNTSTTAMINRVTWIIPTSLLTSLVLLTSCLGFIYNRYRKKRPISSRVKAEQAGEETVMLQSAHRESKFSKDIKTMFFGQIKECYQDQYDAVQPIPYVKDRLFCVDKVFVESGIEYFEPAKPGERHGNWMNLETYQDIVYHPQVKSYRQILEGEPGYGKSTVTLQFAYDWCNARMEDVDVLILLRLRQLGGVSSIYHAIKQFLLPNDTTLTERDIETILKECCSVVIILDGFDEYPDQEIEPKTDIMKIIEKKMFQQFQVVITTRSSLLPKKYPPSTKRLRLTGFNDKSRRFYIRKAIVGEDEELVREIELQLEANPIFSDLCQVPLFFVIFAHMVHESEQFRNLNSVTSFFRYMISSFHSHMKNKMEDVDAHEFEIFETDHYKLDEVAFKAFSGNTQKIVWEKRDLCSEISEEFCKRYLRIGILVEEKVINIIDDPGLPITEHVQYNTEVRFYHKIFCEWYAAHYLINYLQMYPNTDLEKFLQYVDPFDVQYMYRFSCGLNSKCAEKIISYLKDLEGGDKFAILCILEQTGQVNEIKDSIRHLCYEGVIISSHDSRLLQRSSMQLLELASKNNIPIEYVEIDNCLRSVDLSTAAIVTTSDLSLSSWIPIKQLAISLSNRNITKDEAIDILQFASMCPSLSHLMFLNCVPPKLFKKTGYLSTLRSRKVSVQWQWAKNAQWYILNLKSGLWESKEDGSKPTKEDLQRMLGLRAERRNQLTEEMYRQNVRLAREALRKDTEEKKNTSRKNDGMDDRRGSTTKPND